jgi:hypothetical protein
MPVTHLQYSVPRNTAQVGGKVSRVIIKLPCDITFADFWSRVCAQMDLNPEDAEIGYKFHTHRVGDDPIQLATDDDLRVAISTAIGMVQRAHKREIQVIIHNLVSFHLPSTSFWL